MASMIAGKKGLRMSGTYSDDSTVRRSQTSAMRLGMYPRFSAAVRTRAAVFSGTFRAPEKT